jgi:STE24 endopeptidase
LNSYALIILATLIFEHVLNIVADVLNLKTLIQDLPKEFIGVYNDDAYKKSQAYLRTRTMFGFLTSTLSFATILMFWFLGGFNWLDHVIRSAHMETILSGLCYIGVLILARGIFSLPFKIYSTFVIEERFGFNKTTPATFLTDTLKGVLLGVLIGVPLLAGILAFFEYAGSIAWVYCWMAATVFTLIIQFIAPTWIMPLFNKFTPLESGELKSSIIAYAESVRFSLQNVFVMDGSKRSSKSNAFFTGFGKNKRIALFDTLIQKHTVPELVVVLAHEIGHYKKHHIIQGLITSVIHMGVMFFLMSLFMSEKGLFDAFFMDQSSIYTGLIFFGLLYTPIEFVLSLIMNSISRKHEYEADRFAAETTRQPEAMISALKKLSLDNLSHLTPHPFYSFLNYSHPPVLQRIKALRDTQE